MYRFLRQLFTLQGKRNQEKKRKQRQNKAFRTKENEANLKRHKSNMLNDVEYPIKCQERNKLAQRKPRANKRRMKWQQLKQVAWLELTGVIGELNQSRPIQNDPKCLNKQHSMTMVLEMELISKEDKENDEEATATTVEEMVCMDSDADDDKDNNNKYLNDEQLTLPKQFVSQYAIYNKGKLLFIEDTDDFWKKVEALRMAHEEKMKRKTSKHAVCAQMRKVASGNLKELSKAKLKDLIEPLTEKDVPFHEDQILEFIKLFDSFIAMC